MIHNSIFKRAAKVCVVALPASTPRRGYWQTANAVPIYVSLPRQCLLSGLLLNETGRRVHGERPSTSSWSLKFSVSSPAIGSSWYGLTSKEYSVSSYSDDPLSKTTEETKETAIPSTIAKNDTLLFVVVFTPCKPSDVTGVWHCPPFSLMGIKQKLFNPYEWSIFAH